jgi:hypothetical protein
MVKTNLRRAAQRAMNVPPVAQQHRTDKQERPVFSWRIFWDANSFPEKYLGGRINARLASVMCASIARNIRQCNLPTSADMLRFFHSIILADSRR